eukprot:SAG25_NODE_11409_length_305_cov_0.742718_1_plen_46_part_10
MDYFFFLFLSLFSVSCLASCDGTPVVRIDCKDVKVARLVWSEEMDL